MESGQSEKENHNAQQTALTGPIVSSKQRERQCQINHKMQKMPNRACLNDNKRTGTQKQTAADEAAHNKADTAVKRLVCCDYAERQKLLAWGCNQGKRKTFPGNWSIAPGTNHGAGYAALRSTPVKFFFSHPNSPKTYATKFFALHEFPVMLQMRVSLLRYKASFGNWPWHVMLAISFVSVPLFLQAYQVFYFLCI